MNIHNASTSIGDCINIGQLLAFLSDFGDGALGVTIFNLTLNIFDG